MLNNPFEEHLALWPSFPTLRKDAAINVHDTIYTAIKACASLFKEQATPELALEIAKLMLAEYTRLGGKE